MAQAPNLVAIKYSEFYERDETEKERIAQLSYDCILRSRGKTELLRLGGVKLHYFHKRTTKIPIVCMRPRAFEGSIAHIEY